MVRVVTWGVVARYRDKVFVGVKRCKERVTVCLMIEADWM